MGLTPAVVDELEADGLDGWAKMALIFAEGFWMTTAHCQTRSPEGLDGFNLTLLYHFLGWTI